MSSDDAGAALIRKSQALATIQEERLNKGFIDFGLGFKIGCTNSW
jgi:hypothetical protein